MLLIGRFRSSSTVLLELALFSGMISPLYCQLPSKTDRTSAVAIQTVPIKTSVCQALLHPETFDGKLVEIHAEFSATMEGAWISDSECKDDLGELVPPHQKGMAREYADVLRDVAKRYALGEVVRDKAWQEFDSSSRRLYTGMGTTSPDHPTTPPNTTITLLPTSREFS